MRVLVAYATRTGTVAQCAKQLALALPSHEVVLHDLADGIPNTDGYDFIAVGGSVRYGKLDSRVRDFIGEKHDALAKIPSGYFVCCGFTDSGDEYLYKALPGDLYDGAVITSTFGGVLNVKAQRGFFDRMVVRTIINSIMEDGNHDGELKTVSLPSINPDNINRFAEVIKISFARTKRAGK